MICYYGVSLTGRSHREQSLSCQDAHIAVQLTDTLWLAAVADGVGSAACSERGSVKAVTALAEFCSEAIHTCSDWVELLKDGFCKALDAVVAMAQEEQTALYEYDSTLTAVFYDGTKVVYGQSGDSGMIGMDCDGHYELLTQVQKGEAYNEVYPLRCGPSKWTFAQINKAYAGLLLMTDGVLDVAVPPLLFDQAEPLYINFIRRFLSDETLHSTPADSEKLSENCTAFLESTFCSAITDDMTVLAIWNNQAKTCLPAADYLVEPDWAMLRRIRYNRLYPQSRLNEEKDSDDCHKQQK
ncbi:MAG: protein phosphatase 2C domain-containing protein [Ruminiclostridium sp.]|nr:protein phosphatase 2C domain-containing protein [Ruminiclostridium sp.]